MQAFAKRRAGTPALGGVDDNCDGVPESRCWSTDYDGDARELHASDEDCDGTPETCTVATVSPTRRARGYDPDCDGVADHGCHWVSFDGEGRRTAEVDDENCDGEPDGRGCARFVYDESGRLASEDRDHDCDDVPDVCIRLRD